MYHIVVFLCFLRRTADLLAFGSCCSWNSDYSTMVEFVSVIGQLASSCLYSSLLLVNVHYQRIMLRLREKDERKTSLLFLKVLHIRSLVRHMPLSYIMNWNNKSCLLGHTCISSSCHSCFSFRWDPLEDQGNAGHATPEFISAPRIIWRLCRYHTRCHVVVISIKV